MEAGSRVAYELAKHGEGLHVRSCRRRGVSAYGFGKSWIRKYGLRKNGLRKNSGVLVIDH
jgi:hypothetical protein